MRLIEKLAYFDRERIPERVVHAKGAGVPRVLPGVQKYGAVHLRELPPGPNKKHPFSSVSL